MWEPMAGVEDLAVVVVVVVVVVVGAEGFCCA